MEKESLKYIIRHFHERALPEVKPRDIDLPAESNKIISLTGIRRSGKTYLLFHTITKLLTQGVEKTNILYINLEDDRLFPLYLEDMDLILKSYYELYPEKVDEKKYLFFDEIQNVPHWEKYVRRIYDTENIQIFITMVSQEISTGLRGRSISYEVFPLSFKEFLQFKSIDVQYFSIQSEAQIVHALNEYIQIGGFPEIIESDEAIREKIFKEYVDLLLYKDLIEHYGIGNQFLLKTLMKYCLSHPGTLLSINKLYHDFRSQGIELSKNTLYEYMEAMQDAFITFRIPKYEKSLRKQAQNPKKIYVIDTGLLNRFIPDPMADMGKKIENMIFLCLRRKNEKMYYLKNKNEVDFLIEGAKGIQLINVSQSITGTKTLEREIKGLENGLERFPQAEALLVVNETSNRKIPDPIKLIPVWKYLVEG